MADERLRRMREVAGSVPDPELPAVSLAELGVLRMLRETSAGHIEVELTPTYTGCPALASMAEDVERVLREHGAQHVTVRTVLTPPWSTDDITDEGRRKLAEFGIAPPRPGGGQHRTEPVVVALGATRGAPADGSDEHAAEGSQLAEAVDPIRCPRCGSTATSLLSRFSSTACKALRRCDTCREPFDHFKEL
ncbi:iron-sulfur cluster assembly protein [Streptomyces oceani]|uniref:Phenylacetic acid degradation protein PaaD n=1 Tax=Streptomyces oceani TaxID=1075402 RepID=A0A1E7JWT4_9ACTN|nr:iron-sulfur cluster assembly protein [Streptomyces oceani]OEU96119.1 phenylacetic acid degradation protein PaaD [Streptomyces oceani]